MNGDDGGGGGAHFDRGVKFVHDPDHVFKSKYFGVSQYRSGWKGELAVDGVRRNLYDPSSGRAFDTEEEAHLAVEAAKVTHGWKPQAKATKQSG
eukprot:COSAG01_NODE_63069_length_281_cov_1.137363_1_plen_93_part_11